MSSINLASNWKDTLQSSNFWTAVVLLIGGFFVGFPNDDAQTTVGLIFSLIAAGKLFRNYFKDAKVQVKEWVKNSNFWNYLSAIVVALVPNLPGGTIESLEQVVRNLLGGNWQGAIIGAVSLFTILYNIFKKTEDA